jgi:arylsulfatase A-like enzyme
MEQWWQTPMGALARDTWARRPEGAVTDAAYLEALYDQEIRHLDDGVDALLGTLDELGLADDTLVLLTADHGESVTEHSIYFLHCGLYECVVRVPFIARWEGGIPAGRRLPQLLQHHDLAPTILEAVGARLPSEMDGQSFWPVLTGMSAAWERDFAVSCESTWQAKWALRTARHKFILARAPDMWGTPNRELYDLETDPREEHNLVEREPALAAALEQTLEAWIVERLAVAGRDQDPLIEEGVSLSIA